jgi:hypothetical protein
VPFDLQGPDAIFGHLYTVRVSVGFPDQPVLERLATETGCEELALAKKRSEVAVGVNC